MKFGVMAAAGVMLAAPMAARADEAAVDEVVVTAERTNRTLRETSTSVAVVSGRDADALGARSTYDLLERIPNLVATRSSNGAPAVRGIDGAGPAVGGNAFFAGTRPRLNFLVDGRTLTFNEVIYIDGGIWDLAQMEVYRGPQSTLQGRNAVAGVVAIKTADPTFDWTGRARAAFGDYETQQYAAALGGPLVADILAFRLAGEFRREDTYVKIYEVPYDNSRRSQSKLVRGKLLFTPDDALRSLLTLSYTDAYGPQAPLVGRPFKDLQYGYTSSPRFRTRAAVAISDSSYRVSDNLTVSAFATASDFRVNRYTDPGLGIAQIDGREYTIEPRLRFGAPSDMLSGFVAAYLFRARQSETIDLFGGADFKDRTVTKAIFGEVVWRASDQLRITAGARYEVEERDRTGGRAPFAIDYHETFRVFLPRGTAAYSPNDALTFGFTVGKGYNAGGAGFAFNPPFPSFTYDKETVWNYEAFTRATVLDGRLRLSGSVFYNDYSSLQLPFDVAQNPAAPATVIRNAEKAITYGAEFEARFQAHPRLDLFASAGLLKTEVKRYSDPSVEGRDLPRSPAFSFSAGAVARPVDSVELAFDLRYSDSYYSDVFANARGKTDPYVVGNAKASWTHGTARLFVGVTNLFNTRAETLYYPGATAADDVAQIVAPRKVTAGIDLAF
jgi:iron complex outermembrane receptor protein